MMKTLLPISPGNFARGSSLVLTVVLLGLPCVAQVLQPTLSVNGNPLVTARPVTRIGQEWFLPLIPIAEALGIDVSISADSMSLRAQRRDGTEVAYDGRTGEMQERLCAGRLREELPAGATCRIPRGSAVSSERGSRLARRRY